jgi:hypothetical protein
LGINLVVGISWKTAVILSLTTVGFKTKTPAIPDQGRAGRKCGKFPPNRGNFWVIIIRWQILEWYRLEALLTTMDPSWFDIKRILRHGDMAERSRLSYTQVDNKVNQVDNKLNGHEQIILALLHRVEDLEQEKHETGEPKQVVGTLVQRVEALECKCHQLSDDSLPQHSNTGSNSQQIAELPSKGQAKTLGDKDIAPMEIEDQELNHSEIKATLDNESAV